MKTLLLMSSLFILLAFPAHASHVTQHLHDVTVKVNGLVCDFCARSVEKMFGKREEVSQVGVNLDTHEVNIDFKEKASIASEEITRLITDSGYSVVEIIR